MAFRKKEEDADAIIGRLLAGAAGDEGAAGPCPNAEQLAALMDGGLGRGEREAVLAHLAGCEDCRELLRTAVLLSERERETEAPARPWRLGSLLPYAAAAALLVAVLSAALVYKQTHVGLRSESVAMNYARENKSQPSTELSAAPMVERNSNAPEAAAPPAGPGLVKRRTAEDKRAMPEEKPTVPDRVTPENKSGVGPSGSVRLFSAPSMTELPEGRPRGGNEGFTSEDRVIMPLSDMPERDAGTKSAMAIERTAKKAPPPPPSAEMPEPVLQAKTQNLAKTEQQSKRTTGREERHAMAAAPASGMVEKSAKEQAPSIASAECAPAAEGGGAICKLPSDKEEAARAKAEESAGNGAGKIVKARGTIKSIDAKKGEMVFAPENDTTAITIKADEDLLDGFKTGDKVRVQYLKGAQNIARSIRTWRAITIPVGC